MGPFKRNLPNILSLIRLLLIIPFILAIRANDNLVMIVSAASIVLTDYLDGKLARAWNTVSSAGKILDPLADKICTGLAAVSLVYFRGFPLWLLILIILRDLSILAAGLVMMRMGHAIPASNIIGKVTMVTITACLLVYMFNLTGLMSALVILTVAALAASAISYGAQFLRAIAGSAAGDH